MSVKNRNEKTEDRFFCLLANIWSAGHASKWNRTFLLPFRSRFCLHSGGRFSPQQQQSFSLSIPDARLIDRLILPTWPLWRKRGFSWVTSIESECYVMQSKGLRNVFIPYYSMCTFENVATHTHICMWISLNSGRRLFSISLSLTVVDRSYLFLLFNSCGGRFETFTDKTWQI